MEMRGIVKRFPGVLANDRVDFDVRSGEIHALLGENGDVYKRQGVTHSHFLGFGRHDALYPYDCGAGSDGAAGSATSGPDKTVLARWLIVLSRLPRFSQTFRVSGPNA